MPAPNQAPHIDSWWADGVAIATCALLCLLLFDVPVQLSDSFSELITLQGSSIREIVGAELSNGTYFRPLRRALIAELFVAPEHLTLAYRAFHVVEFLVLVVLATRMVRIRSNRELLLVPLFVALLVGSHTFAGTVLEAFPVNHFLTVLICCSAAWVLSQQPGGPIAGGAATLLLVVAALTIESGLIVFAIYVAAAITRSRGMTWRGLVVPALFVATYFVGRFVILGSAAPGLGERSTGFGFQVLEPSTVIERFGDRPMELYLYNFVSATLSVLVGEPRGGVWVFVRSLSERRLEWAQIINVATHAGGTLLIVDYARQRLVDWRPARLTDDDRLVLAFPVVLLANAVFCVVYVKDVIMSPAGLFFATAVFAVVRARLANAEAPRVSRRVLVPLAMFVVSTGATARFIGAHAALQTRAESVRNEWAYYDDWEKEQPDFPPLAPAQVAMREQLLSDALMRRAVVPPLGFGIVSATFDSGQ